MRAAYLEVTFRRGRPVAAYYYLPRHADERAISTVEAAPGVLVDYAEDGRPIGMEITAPGHVTLDTMNQILSDLGFEKMQEADFAPLLAA